MSLQPVAGKQINVFMATNRAWYPSATVSQAAWVVQGRELNLTINDFPLYCSGYRFELHGSRVKVIHLLVAPRCLPATFPPATLIKTGIYHARKTHTALRWQELPLLHPVAGFRQRCGLAVVQLAQG